jgi:hypothetical protein
MYAQMRAVCSLFEHYLTLTLSLLPLSLVQLCLRNQLLLQLSARPTLVTAGPLMSHLTPIITLMEVLLFLILAPFGVLNKVLRLITCSKL